MKIDVTKQAVQWYKDEMDVESGMEVRFFVRYGGVGGLIPGFSLGVRVEEAENIHTSIQVDGVSFYIAEEDAWYFETKDLHVTYDEQLEEPQFTYV